MASLNKCNLYYDENAYHFLVEYRGDFTKEINKVSYACGYAINNSLAIVVVEFENLEKLKQDVPSIIYIDFRSTFILQDISPDYADNIQTVKNPNLEDVVPEYDFVIIKNKIMNKIKFIIY